MKQIIRQRGLTPDALIASAHLLANIRGCNKNTSMNNLATSYPDQGKLREAAKLHEEVLQMRRRTHGEDHSDNLMCMA